MSDQILGAGNAFLGGLAAGLHLAEGDVYEGENKHLNVE
jgi:hypothetical protein